MWRILYFTQLPEQNRLFRIPFHVQTNCFHFVEHTLAKRWWWKLISYILVNKSEKNIFFFQFLYLVLNKRCQPNTGTASCNLFQCSRNLFVKFYFKIKQPASQSLFTRRVLKYSWLVIFREFPRDYSIRCGNVLWTFTSVYIISFSMRNKQ